jgi:peptidoglycan/LPS O-acetylase OafA/YrhL
MNKHLPQLDGLRGIAILIVLLGHLVVFHFGLGIGWLGPLPPVGVDFFFVLSGFLITRILVESKAQTHYFRTFYIRRALRIWPLYFVILTILFGVTNHSLIQLTFDEKQVHWPVFVFYVQNLFYRNPAQMGPLALAVTWSLAVEEQFYAIWPFLVRFLSLRGITIVLSGIILVAPLARFLVPQFGIDPYINPVCRFDAMAIGGLIAIWVSSQKPSKMVVLKTSSLVFLSAVFLELVCYHFRLIQYFNKTIVSFAFGAVLLAVLRSERLATLLSAGFLQFTGRISYCLYLCHLIVAAIAVEVIKGAGPLARIGRCIAIIVISYGVATLSWKFLEEPVLRLKRYFPTFGKHGVKANRDCSPDDPLAAKNADTHQLEPRVLGTHRIAM